MIGPPRRLTENVMKPARLCQTERWIFLFGFLVVNIALLPLLREGHIVFSDIAIGSSADRYLEEIVGVWNQRWSTANFFNLSRLLFVAPLYAITQLTGGSGSTLVKLLIFAMVNIAWGSFLILNRSIFTKSENRLTGDTLVIAIACTAGAVFYALNPWFLTRIQHLYLLSGYALFPLVVYSGFGLFSLQPPQEQVGSGWKISFGTAVRAALFALVFSIACASVHYAIYILPVLALVLIHSTISAPARPISFVILQQSSRLLLAISLFAVTSFHWVSPFFLAYFEGYAPGQNNVNVVETIVLFSRNSDWLNTVTGISYWWPMFSLEELPRSFRIAQMLLLGVITFGLVYCFKYSSKLLVVGAFIVSIAATGAHYAPIAPWYVGFVLSDSNPLGFIFRDPNKLVGPLLLALSIFLSAGVLLVNRVLNRYLAGKYQATSCIFLMVLLLFFLAPFWKNYVLGFYAPVLVPDEYSQVQSELHKRVPGAGRVLYLPSAGNMVESSRGYSSFDWNNTKINDRSRPKASSSFTIFSSKVDTLFQHEGSPLSIDYFLNYLQDLMDKGSSQSLGALISLTGATHVVYQSDYVGQRKRQAFNLEVLKNQEGLKLEYQNKIFSVFRVKDPLPRLSEINTLIHTPYGMNRLTLYKAIGQSVLENADVQFVSANPTLNHSSFRQGDFMEVKKIDDWLLADLPPESVIYPFSQVNEGNPFLKWSKTFVSGQEWQYYLKRENISNFPFDFDYSKGIIFSAAPARLNVAPYLLSSTSGEEVLTPALLADGLPAFSSLEPATMKITIEPNSAQSPLLSISGEYAETALSDSVVAAESRVIPVNQATPYRLAFNLSSNRASSVQVQVVFTDKLGHKIGSEFVASSDASKRRDETTPIGFAFVTPLNTEYIKIELLSRKLKRTRAEWTVKDLSLQSLGQHSGPNKITLDADQFAGRSGQLYVRLFKSKAGGEIQISSNGSSKLIKTFDPNRSLFEWVNVGYFSFGSDSQNSNNQNQSVVLDNQHGLNAINALALIDDETRQNREEVLKLQFAKSRLFLSLDAEADFSSVGQKIDQRTYANLHGGKGFRSSAGELHTEFDIVKPAVYSLSVRAAIDPLLPKPEVSIIDLSSGETLWSATINPTKRLQPLGLYSDNTQGSWNKPFSQMPASRDVLGTWQSDEIDLKKGEYSLLLRLPDIQLSPLYWNQPYSDSALETLTPQTSNLQSAEPASWSILNSARVSVEADQQQFLEIGFTANQMKSLHLKVKYFDRDGIEISVEYVNRPQWEQANGDFKVAQIVTAPKQAQWAKIQILGKPIKVTSGLSIGYSSLTEYATLPLIDWVLLNESVTASSISSPIKQRSVDYTKPGAGLYEISNLLKSNGIKLLESPSVLWQLETNGGRIKPFTVNGLSNMYRFEELSADSVIRYRPETIHRIGLYLLGLFMLLLISMALFYMRRDKRRS
jgi:hypothetical protein